MDELREQMRHRVRAVVAEHSRTAVPAPTAEEQFQGEQQVKALLLTDLKRRRQSACRACGNALPADPMTTTFPRST
jgi:hypothetical protein